MGPATRLVRSAHCLLANTAHQHQRPVVTTSCHTHSPNLYKRPTNGGVSGISRHENKSEAIVALAADCLDGGCRHAVFGGQHLVEAAHPLHPLVLAVGVDDRAVSDHVVDDDHAAASGEANRPTE